MLKGYDKFGGLGPQQYLNEWLNDGKTSYKNPPGNGFTIDECGDEIRAKKTFTRGQLLDRVGATHGRYLAPVCDPIKNRAIPPRNLCRTDRPVYTVFEVCKNFSAEQGLARPWFSQQGNGNHITLADSTSVLVNRTVLRQLDETEVAGLSCPSPTFTPRCPGTV
jgi:hypothetical protein